SGSSKRLPTLSFWRARTMGTLSTVVLLVCSSLGTTPLRSVTIDQVELIEYNHFYDERGRHVFDQLIFYDWSRRESRYQIRDWGLIKTVSQAPYFASSREVYMVTWHDGMTLRQVRSPLLRETW